MTGHQIKLGRGWKIDKGGKLRPPPPKDASAKLRERPGGSKKVRVDRAALRSWQRPLGRP